MNNTIKDLWQGSIAPCEHCGSHDQKATNLLRQIERNRESLRNGLSQAQMELFQKYIDCSDEYELHMMELAFCDGFILGSRLTKEALQ